MPENRKGTSKIQSLKVKYIEIIYDFKKPREVRFQNKCSKEKLTVGEQPNPTLHIHKMHQEVFPSGSSNSSSAPTVASQKLLRD